jgi:hypothetical protein
VQSHGVAEEGQGLIEIPHRDPDVIEDGYHFSARFRISAAAE